MTIDARDAHAMIALLGEYQSLLEDAISNCLVDGETQPRDPVDQFHIGRDRRCWRRAEQLVRKLDELVRHPAADSGIPAMASPKTTGRKELHSLRFYESDF